MVLVEIEIDESLYNRLIAETQRRYREQKPTDRSPEEILVDVLCVAVDLGLNEIQKEVKAVA